MPIDVTCPVCRRALYLSDDLAGRQIRCPGCQNVLTVPTPDWQPSRPETMEPPPPQVEEVLPAARPPAVAPVDVFRERLDEPPPKPKPLPRPRLPVQPAEADSEFGGKATVGGGLLMMVIGAAWAGLAFWAGWISFYAILLFIGGLVAFIRGLLKKRGTD